MNCIIDEAVCNVSRYQNEEFKAEVTKEYLAERSQYRLTGVPKKRYQRGHGRPSANST